MNRSIQFVCVSYIFQADIPVKWAAPEVLSDLVFTHYSDM